MRFRIKKITSNKKSLRERLFGRWFSYCSTLPVRPKLSGGGWRTFLRAFSTPLHFARRIYTSKEKATTPRRSRGIHLRGVFASPKNRWSFHKKKSFKVGVTAFVTVSIIAITVFSLLMPQNGKLFAANGSWDYGNGVNGTGDSNISTASGDVRLTQSIFNGYSYKKDITFDTTAQGANVATSQTNFPVAVHINSSSWTTAGDRTNFFNDTYNPFGKRINFYDADGTTRLAYEVEYYNTSGQEAIYWVKVPQVDGNSATDKIIVGYGNDPNGSDQDQGTSVWPSNTADSVYHAKDGTTSTIVDSTSSARTLTKKAANEPIEGAQNIGRGQDFDGTDDFAASSGNYTTPNALTWSFWINPDTDPNEASNWFMGDAGNGGNAGFYIGRGEWDAHAGAGISTLYIDEIQSGSIYERYRGGVNIPSGSWSHITITQSAPGVLPVWYLNGTAQAAMTQVLNAGGGCTTRPATQYPLELGRPLNDGTYGYFDGKLDEARLTNSVRDADWTKLEYYSTKKTTYNGDNGAGANKFINFGAQSTGSTYQTPGVWTSNGITATGIYGNWGNLAFTETKPAGTATSYKVYQSDGDTLIPDGDLAGNSSGFTTSPVDLSTVSTTTYSTIKVKATLSCTTCTNTPEVDTMTVSYTYDTTAPTVPTNLSIGTVTNNTIPLSWDASTDSESGIQGYEVQRAPDSGGSPGTWANVASGPCSGVVATNSCSDTTVSSNTKYYYKIRAKDNENNTSAYSGFNSYIYKKDITFDTTAQGANVATNQTDFPIAVHINSSSWSTASERTNFFGTYNTNGKRIDFYDADGSTRLAYEVEYYSSSTQEAIYWVKVPQVDGNSATDKITVGYGNDAYGEDRDQGTSVWDSNYKGVYHLGDNSWVGTPPESLDSTSNNIDGTNVGTTDNSAALIGKSRSFSGGANNYVSYGDVFDPTNNITISGWIKATDFAALRRIIDKGSASGTGSSMDFFQTTAGKLNFAWYNGGWQGNVEDTTTLSADTWYHVVVAYDNSNIKYYINGNLSSSAAENALMINNNKAVTLGSTIDDTSTSYKGSIDEVRISIYPGATVRSADWIKLEYYSTKKTAYNGDNGAGTSKLITNGAQVSMAASATTLTETPALNAFTSPTTDSTPQIVGVTDADLANVTIRLYDNGVLAATTTANGSGAYTFANGDYSAPLSEGAHTNLTARSVNADLAESADSNALSVTIDSVVASTALTTDPASADGTNSYFKTNPTITLTPTDPAPSAGNGTTTYKWDDADMDPDPLTYSSPLNMNTSIGQGVHTLYWRTTDTAGNIESIQSQEIKLDSTAPTVTNVTSTNDNGTYVLNDQLDITVTFSETVVVTGTPLLTLEMGGTDRDVNYSSGTGTDTLVFNYTIQTGDNNSDLDYVATTSLALNTGTIKDTTAGNDATLTLASPGAAGSLGANKNINVDTVAPSISSVTSTTANAAYNADDTVNVTVNFSENVTLAGGNLIVTLETGTTDRTVTIAPFGPASTASGTYTVQATDASADLTAQSPLALSAGTLRDVASNNSSLTIPEGQNIADLKSIVIDTVAPTTAVTSVPASADGTNDYFKTNPSIILTPSDASPSGGTGTTYYKWDVAEMTSPDTYSTAIDMNATIGQGDHTLYYRTIDSAGNEQSIQSQQFKLDSQAPTVTNVTSNTANATYVIGNTIDVRVTFTEAVAVTGTPYITLETGTTNRNASYASGTGSSTLVFNYTVQSGDTATDLDYVGTDSLNLNTGTIKDNTAGNDATLTLASPGAAGSLGANKALAVDGVAPTITSISSTTDNGSYGLAQTVNVTVNFSEAVTLTGGNLIVTVETGDTDRTATISSIVSATSASGLYVIQSNDSSSDLNVNSLALSAGTLRDASGNDTVLDLPAGQNLADNKNIAIDTVAPTVTGVSSNSDNGTYVAGSIIDVRITFTEAVTVTGTPKITLNTTPTLRNIDYSSGSGSTVLVFNYTVQSGDTATDLDYVNPSALYLNGGTVKDASTNNADLTLPAPGEAGSLGANKNIAVDTSIPSVTNVTSNKDNGSYKVGDGIDIRVTFSESVIVTGTPQITLETGTTDRAVNYSSGSGSNTLVFNYTVQTGDTSTDLDYNGTTALALNLGTIKDDAANNAILTLASPGASGSLAANKALVIDTTAPTVSGVSSSSSNGYYKEGSTIDVRVTFTESVNVTGTPYITLETGSTDRNVNYSSGSGSTVLVFNYTVQSGDTSTDLDYNSTGALNLNSGTITDTALNSATLTLASPGATNSLGANKALIIDTTSPSVASITSTTSNGSYKAGQTVNITVNFSEAVTLTYGATLDVTLETGDTDRTVSITPFSSSTSASGTYTVQSGDASADLAGSSPLVVTGGTLRDAATNDITLTIPNGQNISDSKNIVIDTVAPTTSLSTSPVSADGTNSYFKTDPLITLTVSDPTPSSGNGTTYYKWDDAAFSSPSTYSAAIDMDLSIGQGTHTLYFRTTDTVGNTETLKSQQFKLDSAMPTGASVTISSGDSYETLNPVNLTLSATDVTSGMNEMQFSNDGVTFSAWETYGTSKTWDLTDVLYGGSSGDGTKTVYVKYKDNADNTTSAASDSIVLDTENPTNPSSPAAAQASTSDSTALTSGNWYNYTAPKFTLSGATDTTSGIDGYLVYWGTSQTADPAVSGTFQESNIYNPTLLSNDTGKTYYLRVRARDEAGNIYVNADTTTYTFFTYKFDITNPTGVDYITANPSGYSNTNSFDFTWPVATDPEVNSDASGIAGYEYKKQIDSDWTFAATNSITDVTSYQNGVNVLQVRTKDNAGNYSDAIPVNYYYSGNIPAPTNLQADLSQSQNQTVNNFKFTWTAPEGVTPEGYYYSVNAVPTTQNTTFTEDAFTDYGPFATNQGLNTFYVVTKDENGNVGWANYAQVSFTCNTSAPGVPLNVLVTDASNREASDWALAIKWTAPSQLSNDINGYVIERSVDEGAYSQIATTSLQNTGYLDTNLDNTKNYAYRVKTRDNTGNVSITSTVVEKIPTGRYTTAPEIIGSPSFAVKTTKADISFVTDREADSFVQVGITASYGMTQGQLDSVKTHKVALSGLTPGTIYHFRAMWRDSDGNIGYSNDQVFKTTDAASISEVKVSDITLDSAVISWETNTVSTSTVKYGETSAYGAVIEDESGSSTTIHTIRLTELKDGTTYNFKIGGSDTEGNAISSDNYVFTTLPRPRLSNIKYEQAKESAIPTLKISWESNVPVSSTVNIFENGKGIPKEVAKALMETKHALTMTNLKDNTNYTMVVKGRDNYGNEAVSDTISLKTALDSRPPLISNITIESSLLGFGADAKGQLVVSWETDEMTSSQVVYGVGSQGTEYSYRTQEDTSVTTQHVVIISDLKPSTSYHFAVISKDQSGNTVKSQDQPILTEQATESVVDVVVKSLQNSIGWIFGALFSSQ